MNKVSQRRRTLSPVTVIATVGVMICITLGVHYYVAPEYWRGFPFSCNLPSTDFEPTVSSSCEMNDEYLGARMGGMINGSEEIEELTGYGDTLISLLNANLSEEDTAEQVAASLSEVIQNSLNKPFDRSTPLKPGKRYSISVDRDGQFLKAVLELDPAQVFHAAVKDGVISSWREEVVLEFKTESVCFPVRGDLAESVMNAGEGLELALKLTTVFRWDIDFRSESIRGDVCKILFERRYADDRPSGYGRILCAVYEGKKTGRKTAFLFNNEYYCENGVELKKNFLRSPLSEIRVTSRYGNRFHPILRIWRKHCGVDYGAPQGTPVWAVASGIVTFSGWNNGYGNYVCVKHDNGYESRYGHLQRIFVAKGQRLRQRQRIGTVGMTGIATGPHLDFQLLAGNKHVNPLGVKMVRDLRTVPAPLKQRFTALSQERLMSLGSLVVSRQADVAQRSRVD